MPLNKILLEAQLLEALTAESVNPEKSRVKAQADLAKALANIIDAYIKSATIIIPAGQPSTGQTAPGITTTPAALAAPCVTVTPGVVTTTTSAPSPKAIIT